MDKLLDVNISEIIVINLFENEGTPKNNTLKGIKKVSPSKDRYQEYKRQASFLKKAKDKVNTTLQKNIDYLTSKTKYLYPITTIEQIGVSKGGIKSTPTISVTTSLTLSSLHNRNFENFEEYQYDEIQ